MRLPVRGRLTLAFAAVIAAVLGATGLFVHERLASNLDASINRSLRSRSADVAALARGSERGLAETDAEDASRQHVPALAQVVDAAGHAIDGTPGLPARPLLASGALARARAGHRVLQETRVRGGRIRLIAVPVRAQDQLLVVIVGESLEDRARALDNLADVLLLGGPSALLLASLAGYLLIGAALRPVEAIRRRERTFVADASHELRSPLAMLRTELELLGRERPVGEDLQRAVGSAIEETDRLSGLADELLLLARADDSQLALRPEPVPAAELLQAAAARAGDPRVVVDGRETAIVFADVARAGQALDNLLANARRYAVQRITLHARSSAGGIELHVLDDGPCFPVAFLPHAWERFSRADGGRTEDGAGLGLAIVRKLADLHGASAGAANRPGGGADVWIELPRVQDSLR